MGASVPSLGFAYKKAQKVQFHFTNVQSFSVTPFELGGFMTKGSLSTDNPFVGRYFIEERPDAFVITEVIKSNSVTVKAEGSSGNSLSLDLPAIQQAVGAKVGVTTANAQNSELTYQGQEMLTFGHKVFRIEFTNGKWTIRGQKASGDVAFVNPNSAGDHSEEPSFIAGDTPFVCERLSRIK